MSCGRGSAAALQGDDATHTSRGHCRVAAPCAFEVCDIVGGTEVALGSGESGEGEDGEGEGEQ